MTNNTKEVTILVVDDDPDLLELLAATLSNEYNVATARTGSAAIEKIKKSDFNILLTDIHLADMSGWEVLKAARKVIPDICVIMITGYVTIEHSIRAIDEGAYSFLTKPFNTDRILLTIKRAVEMQKISVEREQLLQSLKEANKKLMQLSVTDSLTGLYNHRHMHERFAIEFARAKRYHTSISCLMMDLDHFKKINDMYGHQFGDKVLKEVAHILKHSVREIDICARYGGEEFIIILPETNQPAAGAMAERIRKTIEQHSFHHRDQPINITTSLGAASYPESKPASKDELIKFADDALYQAKEQGRNVVCVSG